jgi:hypothetical protein
LDKSSSSNEVRLTVIAEETKRVVVVAGLCFHEDDMLLTFLRRKVERFTVIFVRVAHTVR